MICFKDQTFCQSDCINTKCFRNFSQEQRAASERWWKGLPGFPPIAFSDFSKTCREYQ